MNRLLQRLSAAVTLPVKGLGLGLLCGILTWVVLDALQSRHLHEVLLEEAQEQLRDEAASNRMIFHRYLNQHVQLTKLIASYQPLVSWLDQRQDPTSASGLSRYNKERPDWFPPLSTWRGLIDPGHFLLHDVEGNLQAIYRLAENDLTIDTELQNILATGRSDGQMHLVALGGRPHLITASAINNPLGQKLGTLTLISRIDDEFLHKLSHATDYPRVILALVKGEAEHLVASSHRERLSTGEPLEELRRDYLATGKPFFDYGSSELRLKLATLVPLDKVAALNASILGAERNQRLIAAFAFTLTFTLLIFSWSRRIEGVLRNIHGFSQHVSGDFREFKVRGDALWQLEGDFVRLRDEILEARESLSEQQHTLQRLKQLELLESVADHLGIGVVLLGAEGDVELQTQQVDRFETTLGNEWYRPFIQRSVQEKVLDLKDEQQNQYTFNVGRLSLFGQGDVVLIQNVTDQKHLQMRLQEQEKQFQRITESARDAIISIDRSGAVTYWNRAAEDMFQYPALEIIGEPVTHIMPASYRQAHESGMKRIGKGGASHALGKTRELEGLRKDGTAFPVELSLSAWQMDGNSYFTGILRDITERKHAEQRLQESESRFALFMERLPAAIFIKESRGRIVYVNEYLKMHFGAGDSRRTGTAGDLTVEVVEQLSCDDQMVLAEGWCEIVDEIKDSAGQTRILRTHNFAIPRAQQAQALVGGIAWDITDTVAASEALRNSERRYREIFELAQEGIWLIDAETNTVDVNARMAEMLGYTPDEMLGRPVFDFFDERAREEAEVLLERRRQGVAEKYDFRFRTKAGAELWMMVSTAPMYDAQGVYAGALRMVTDITERKRSEEAVRAQEEQLRIILASTGEGIFGLDMNGCCTFANRACIELLGYTDEGDLLGKRMHERIHHTRHDGTEYPETECPTYRSCTLCHITFADDELLWRADGSAFHAEYQSFPMVRDDSVFGAVVSFADITERKQAEAALKQERDFAERLIEMAPVIVLVLDPQGNIVRFNSFMERLSGYSLAEVKGKNWFETFLAECDVPSVAEVFAGAKGGVSTHGNVNAVLTRDGSERLIAWYDTTLQDSAGELSAVLAIGHDVTEQKAKEAQLLQAQKMEAVGQLTGGIAHDFNNLLTVILGNLDLLAKSIGPDFDPDLSDLLQDSLSAAQDGAELTQRLLEVSRKKPLQGKRIELPAFLDHFQRFLRRTLRADIPVELNVEANLDRLFCDPSQLENALLNLALNARDAMPRGGQLSLRAEAKEAADLDPTLKPGTYVAIAVIDTGQGMPPEQLSRAIEPFYTTKRSGKGSGLGLSMVYGFCEQAGGRFRLESEPGVGTRATIILPLNGVDSHEAVQTAESTLEALAGKGRVLVVEDEQRIRKLAGRYLKDLGYEVLMAENGDKALEVLQSEPAIELVFSDVAMPGQINGDDLYRWIKAQLPEVKVLLTTGLGSTEIEAFAKDDEAPLPIALRKPYTKEQLAEAIQELFTI